jgi:hypothetical protein
MLCDVMTLLLWVVAAVVSFGLVAMCAVTRRR